MPVLLALLAACHTPPRFTVTLRVVDEDGALIPDADARLGDEQWKAGIDGLVRISGLDHPVMLIVEAPGRIPEPVPVGRDDTTDPVDVPLLDDAGGTRRVLHTAGDVMVGRRYLEPKSGEPLVTTGDDGASARAVVSDIADAFALADVSMVNLETVVGEFADEDAYPKKRFLLLTPPEGLAALDSLGVDVASLANNHQRDWLDPGVASTLDLLDAADLPRVGAGLDADAADAPLFLDVGGFTVAVLSYTSVDGSYVNQEYPVDEDDAPQDLDEDDAWKWEAREWGAPELGVEVADRRIGSAWEAFVAAAEVLDDAGDAELWASLEDVYPEMQDWVAHYGHGGANPWDDVRSPAEIADAKARADLVVVQLHMSFQFAAVPGIDTRAAAYAAVDAGADLVSAHHPHVLQGMEVYKGVPIAWSMGNFVFDQDFLSTFRSCFLRTVWEADGTLVQARVVPTFLDAYRPVPVADRLGRDVLRKVWEGSMLDGNAERGEDLAVRTTPLDRDPDSVNAAWRREHGTLVLADAQPPVQTARIEVPASGDPVSVAAYPIVRRRLSGTAPDGVQVGRSLFGLGSFEDEDGDTTAGEAAGWTWESDDVGLTFDDAYDGLASLQLIRHPTSTERVSARPLARVMMPEHRLYADADGVTPLDGDATASVLLHAWVSGETDGATVRLALYHFDDSDPTEDPVSELLREVEKPVPLTEGRWVTDVIDLTADDLAPVDGLTPNAILLYLSLAPPARRTTVLRVDDVEMIEWRDADLEPEGWAAVDWLRATDGEGRPVEVDYMDW